MQKIIGYKLDSIRGGRKHDKIFYIFIYKIFLLFEHHFSSEPNEFRSCSCLIPPESQMQPDNQRGYYPSLVVTFCRTSTHPKNLINTSGTYVWVLSLSQSSLRYCMSTLIMVVRVIVSSIVWRFWPFFLERNLITVEVEYINDVIVFLSEWIKCGGIIKSRAILGCLIRFAGFIVIFRSMS